MERWKEGIATAVIPALPYSSTSLSFANACRIHME